MKRRFRSIAACMILVLLFGLIPQAITAPPAQAAGWQDPLGLLPDWADLNGGGFDPGAPPNPLAGLLPPDPLAGLLPGGQVPGAPTPQAQDGASLNNGASPGMAAPGALQVPTPPEAPDCGCGPGTVSVGTGAVGFSETDLNLPGVGPDLALTRRYDSTRAGTDGPFGNGWTFNLENRLQMYVHYDITEQRGDGGLTSFTFQDGTNGQFVYSFDDDSMIHLNLAQGSYAPSGAPGWSLERQSRDSYVVTHADGTRYTYFGYYAPWRSNQSPKAGRLTAVTDRNGNTLAFTYDDGGHLTQVADSLGRSITLTWVNNHIEQVKDHAGRTFAYRFQGSDLVEVTATDYPDLTYAYDPASHRLTERDGGAAGRTTYGYDSQGRVTQAGDAAYSYAAGKTTYSDPSGGSWQYELDNQQRVTALTDPTSRVTRTYNADGRKERVEAPDGTTTYTYDDRGNIRDVTAHGLTTHYEYNGFDQVTLVRTPTGTTQSEYDARGNLLARTGPDGMKITYTYDSKGRKESETRAGQTASYTYDDAPHGRPVTITNPLGEQESRTYSPLGQVTKVVDTRGYTSTFAYDQAMRPVASTGPEGGVSGYQYDAAGRLIGVTDAAGGAHTYMYDDKGRVWIMSIKDGPTYHYTYDRAGRVFAALDPSGNLLQRWDRDGAGRRI